MQHLHNRQTSIQADKIRQRQRTHWNIRSILHDRIDILFTAYAGLQADDRFVDIRHQNPVCQEAGGVGGLGGDLAHAFDKGDCGFESRGGCLQAGNDFYALLDGYGVHEVCGYDSRGGTEVGGVVGVGGAGDLGDGYGRRVGREDGMGWADLGQ